MPTEKADNGQKFVSVQVNLSESLGLQLRWQCYRRHVNCLQVFPHRPTQSAVKVRHIDL